jgi:hypothetical protein
MEQLATMSSSGAPAGLNSVERGRLDTTLLRLSDLVTALEAGRDDANPAALLSQWRVDLELHFALEEADSHFGMLLREHPSLSHGIAELRSEHNAFLEEVDRVRPLAADRSRWPELRTSTMHLLERFRAHEHKETELWQESVLRDDGVAAD